MTLPRAKVIAKRAFWLLFACLTLTNCATTGRFSDGEPHEAFLMINDTKPNVLSQLREVGLYTVSRLAMTDPYFKRIDGYTGPFPTDRCFILLFADERFKEIIILPEHETEFRTSNDELNGVRGYRLSRKGNRIEISKLQYADG